MATEKFKFVRNFDGNNNVPAVHLLPVAASQTIVVGDALALSSGSIVKGGAAFGRCLGIAAEDSASATAGTLIKFYVSQPGQVWRATASADATSALRASRTYDLTATTQTVDVADTTGGCVYILELNNTAVTDIDVMFTAHELA
jgi:hypothetical protein